MPVHSGMGGGALPDAAIALNVILGRLYWNNGKLPIPGYYDQVRQLTDKERAAFRNLPGDEAKWRQRLRRAARTPFRHARRATPPYEQTWRQPAVTVIAQEASSIKGASNQVLPKASAIVSCRIVPDQDPDEVLRAAARRPDQGPAVGRAGDGQAARPAGQVVDDRPERPGVRGGARRPCARASTRTRSPIGCGGTIGFVGPLADLFGGAPALLLGIEDPPAMPMRRTRACTKATSRS